LTFDLKKIDPKNMYTQIFSFPDQLKNALNIGINHHPKIRDVNITSVVIAGMGGSGIGGELIKALTADSVTIPIEIVKDYNIPFWVSSSTLVICISYSGNTEETLSCYNQALVRGAKVLGITSGGELLSKLKKDRCDFINIGDGNPPRASLGYLAIPALIYLCDLGLCAERIKDEISHSVLFLLEIRESFSKQSKSNPAMNLAMKIYDSIPIIYGDARYTEFVALRLRGQLEENAKMLGFHHTLPEMNHNEIVGYYNNPMLLKKIGIIWLIDKSQHSGSSLRQSLTKDLIRDTVKYQEEIISIGNSITERLLYLLNFCDWVSYWCAILHDTDPTPVKLIEELKQKLYENRD
tara:strand:- start:9310 stop:10362 length:1053 start_codon:yes stop_codon:yes gene_type:complete